jgi:hypothetical protein
LLSLSKSAKFERKVTTVVFQAASQSCDAEGLAGCSADEEVDFSIFVFLNRCEVAVQWHVGIVVLKNGAGELFNLRKEGSLPTHVVPCGGGGLDAAAN